MPWPILNKQHHTVVGTSGSRLLLYILSVRTYNFRNPTEVFKHDAALRGLSHACSTLHDCIQADAADQLGTNFDKVVLRSCTTGCTQTSREQLYCKC